MIAITTTSLRRYVYQSVAITCLTLTPWVGDSRFAIANPNNSQPDAYLDIHGVVPEAVQLGAECIQTYESFRDLVNQIDKKFDSKKFSAAFVAYQKFLRLNARLKLFGEPLSYDLQLRRTDPEVRLNAIRSSYLPTRECSEIVQKNRSRAPQEGEATD